MGSMYYEMYYLLYAVPKSFCVKVHRSIILKLPVYILATDLDVLVLMTRWNVLTSGASWSFSASTAKHTIPSELREKKQFDSIANCYLCPQNTDEFWRMVFAALH